MLKLINWINFAQLLGPNSTAASGKRNIINPFEHFCTIDIYLGSICTVDILEESCFECFHTNDILNVLTPLISWKHLVLVLMLIFSHFGNAHPLWREHRRAVWPSLDQERNHIFTKCFLSSDITGSIFRNRTKSNVIENCSSASAKFISGIFNPPPAISY